MQSSTIWRACRTAFVLAACLASASAAAAQTITDARRVEFSPSTDHSVVDANGTQLLTGYSLKIFAAGGTSPLQTVDLGKPAPGTDGLIRLDFVALLPTALTPGVLYESLVEAVGPGGRSASTRSNTFSFTPPCSPSISPATLSVTAAGGTGSSAVTAATGCAWSAVSNNTWITVISGAAGSGSGSVAFSVAANTATTSRSGTLTIAGSTFTVTQAAGCSFTVSPRTVAVTSAVAGGTLTVTTQSGCAWSASNTVSWITVTGAGTGSGQAMFTIAANTATTARTGTFTVAALSVTVTQGAASLPPNSPTNLRVVR
jgi:hypothetical protein